MTRTGDENPGSSGDAYTARMAPHPPLSPTEEYAGRALLALTAVGNRIEGLLRTEGVDDYVIRNTPLATLLLLWFEGPLRPVALAEQIGMTTGGMTKVIDQLAERDLVERSSDALDDGRGVLVELTGSGRELVSRACAASFPALDDVVGDLNALRRTAAG